MLEPLQFSTLECFSLLGQFPPIPLQHIGSLEPLLQGPFHVAVCPGWITVARVLHGLLQEPHLVGGRGEELVPESSTVVMSNMAEGVGQSAVEPVGEALGGKVALDKTDELLGEPHFVLGGVPFGCGELGWVEVHGNV